MMADLVHVDPVDQPGGQHLRDLLMLGIPHQQASPLPVAVSIDIGIHGKAEAISVAAFVSKRNRPHAGEFKGTEPKLVPLRQTLDPLLSHQRFRMLPKLST